jgi:hypothetical protein
MTIVCRIYDRAGALLDVGGTHQLYIRLTHLARVKT